MEIVLTGDKVHKEIYSSEYSYIIISYVVVEALSTAPINIRLDFAFETYNDLS